MTIQDPPQHAELTRLPPEPEDDDWCTWCGFAWDDCMCERHVVVVDEREGGSRAEARLEREERT